MIMQSTNNQNSNNNNNNVNNIKNLAEHVIDSLGIILEKIEKKEQQIPIVQRRQHHFMGEQRK